MADIPCGMLRSATQTGFKSVSERRKIGKSLFSFDGTIADTRRISLLSRGLAPFIVVSFQYGLLRNPFSRQPYLPGLVVSISDGVLHCGVKVLQRLKVFHFGVLNAVRVATGARFAKFLKTACQLTIGSI